MAGLIFKTGWIQIHQGEELQKKAIEQQTRDRVINSKRGTIYDRNGKVLAMSASVETITAVPNQIKEDNKADLISDGLAVILDMDREGIYNRVTRNSSYEIIKRRIDRKQADLVREFINENDIKGINLDEDSKRFYPYGSFASHVIGFTGDDNQGLGGIEIIFDKYLKGLPGRIVSAKNASGTDMPFKHERYINPEDGVNVILTIDEVIQHFVEKHLEDAVINNKVEKGGAAIVMDPKTGDILAMAVKPDFDLNNPFRIQNDTVREHLETLSGDEYLEKYNIELQKMWRNKAVADTYEPGSTFKIITSAVALEEGAVKTSDLFNCTGSVRIGGHTIHCWRTGRPHGTQSFVQGVYNSCNPVFIEVGQRTGKSAFYRYFEAFGFKEMTGISLPGEALGLFHSQDAFNEVELATASFGQGFQITPLQMISAVASVANDGKLMKPNIVRQLTDDEGNVLKTHAPQVIRQPISRETSQVLREILEGVVSGEGTGGNAYVKGFRVAGKTGTSEKVPRNQGNYIASFAGFAPANDPEVVVLVLLDEPKGESYYGGVIAAPVVGKILDDVLRYLGVEPEYSGDEDIKVEVAVPELRNHELGEAKRLLEEVNLLYRVEGNGATVIDQVPKPEARLFEESQVILYTEGAETYGVEVPDVIGKSVIEANRIIIDAGLNIRITGTGIGALQEPLAGSVAEPGSIVHVEFRLQDVD